MEENIHSSFRDPSGFVFYLDGQLFRQINLSYKNHYDHLMQSGLYDALIKEKLLIPHIEIAILPEKKDCVYKTIKPKFIPFISYPYEWCFSQLKDAALITLKIQKIAIKFGMSLKDASAFNVQFRNGKPIFIDTLSFELFLEGQPWIAYKQFCQHFLAPLALMSFTDIRLNQFFRIYIDGIPLDLASKLLPFRSWFKFTLSSHIHMHSKAQNHFADKSVKIKNHKISKLSYLGIIDSLETAINKLKWKPHNTEWVEYYSETNYSQNALNCKKELVSKYLKEINPKFVWDMGANTGLFSRLASDNKIHTVSFDIDSAAVEKNYLNVVEKGETHILPLCIDLTNPSPNIGWNNKERISLFERKHPDTIMTLALIHHLSISNNLPFEMIANFFSKLCSSIIIEFVPKNDSQVQRLIANREDIFYHYTKNEFENAFRKYFSIVYCDQIIDSERILYLMKNYSYDIL